MVEAIKVKLYDFRDCDGELKIDSEYERELYVYNDMYCANCASKGLFSYTDDVDYYVTDEYLYCPSCAAIIVNGFVDKVVSEGTEDQDLLLGQHVQTAKILSGLELSFDPGAYRRVPPMEPSELDKYLVEASVNMIVDGALSFDYFKDAGVDSLGNKVDIKYRMQRSDN